MLGRLATLPALGLALLVGGGLLAASPAEASHFRYGNVSWKSTGNPGEVEFNVKVGFRRSAYNNPKLGDSINLDAFFFGDFSSVNPPFRISAISTTEDWLIGEAVIRKAYAGPGPYSAGFNSAARISNLNNGANGSYRVVSKVAPRSGNNSPATNLVPIVTVPAGHAHFSVPATDPDNDPIRFRLANAAENGGAPPPPGMSIDSATGEVHWDNAGLNQTNPWTVQIVVEDLDPQGNVKSSSPVDILLLISNAAGTAPEIDIHPHGPVTVAPGTPVSLVVQGSDLDGQNVTLNTSGLPAGASMSPSLPLTGGPGVSSTFNWTPTAAQAGTYVLSFSATDTTGLQSLHSITLIVPANQAPVANAGIDQAIEATGALTAVRLEGSGSDADGDPLSYEWYLNNVQVGSTAALDAELGVGQHTFTLRVKDDKNGVATDSVVVDIIDSTAPELTVPSNITEEATGPDGAIVNFSASASDVVHGAVSVEYSNAPGSIFPVGSTTVTVTAQDAAGNKASKSFQVSVVDTTAPVLTVPGNVAPLTAITSAGATATFAAPTATDAVDSDVEITLSHASGSLFGLGATTVTVTATDNAGNKTTKTFTVIVKYEWSDILQPINRDGSSVFKLGSTVPVKFQLTGASAGITDAVAKLSYRKVDSKTGAVNEAVSTAAATTGNLFRYDATSGQYIFNWGTKSVTSGPGTYEVSIDLGDGVARKVNVDLK